MPEVTLHLYAGFRRYTGGKAAVRIEIQPGRTIEQLLHELNVPAEETRIVFCNNRIVDLSHVLQGGETVGVFPAVGGG